MMLRTGIVHSVDAKKKTARVKYPLYEGMISAEMKILNHGMEWLPEVNDNVLCLCVPDGDGDGYIVGRF